MESSCTKSNDNVYMACRKEAAIYNDKLNSREGAAELLGISPSTLANHELGVTKNVPVDTVVMMADLYRAPQLKNLYCKNECPIGRSLPVATELKTLEGITVRILNSLDADKVQHIKRTLLQIAEDGRIDGQERPELDSIVDSLDVLAQSISELRLLAEKCKKGAGENGTCRTPAEDHGKGVWNQDGR